MRVKSTEELSKFSQDLQEEVFRLRFRKGAGQLKQTANIRKTQRDLARVKTILVERERSAAKEAK